MPQPRSAPMRDTLFIYDSFLPDIPFTPPPPCAIGRETARLACEAGIDLAADADWLRNHPRRAARIHTSFSTGQTYVSIRVIDLHSADGWTVALVEASGGGKDEAAKRDVCPAPCFGRSAVAKCQCNTVAFEALWGATYSSPHANAIVRQLVVPKAAREALNLGGWFYRFSRIGDKPGRGRVTWAEAAARA